MRIALVISSLSHGGAERVLSRLASHWSDTGHHVTVLTLGAAAPSDYGLPSAVARLGLGLLEESTGLVDAIRSNRRRVARLREALADVRPDVVVSFMDRTNVLVLLAARGTPVRVVVSERVDPRVHDAGRFWSALRRLTYPRASALVVQVAGLVKWGGGVARPDRVHVIPNHVDPPRGPAAGTRERTVLAVGRLTRQKGFDALIRAFSTLRAPIAEGWKLLILGEGEQRPALEALARDANVGDAVELPGRVSDTSEALSRASMFVLSSRYEGFPNALLEAMAAGLPVVAFDCPTGPAEIIRPGIDGLLVKSGDEDALANAMNSLMMDAEQRQSLGARATEVVERFGSARVMAMWDRLIETVAGERVE